MQEGGAPPVHTLTPVQARESRNPVFIELGGPPEPLQNVENMTIPSPSGQIPVRIYAPQGSGPFPVLVYFHGGGWVICNLDTHDSVCRSLAKGASCAVVSIDYRLAPEHKFPAAVEDAYAATQWMADNASPYNIDQGRIAVGGDSAGGNLAAVVCQMAREKNGPFIGYQLLVYPATNLSSFDTDSYREHGEGYILTKESMEYYCAHYLEVEDDSLNPYASPLLAEHMSGLPPALVITAEFDVLTDEGEAYANRLKQAGVPVNYVCFKGLIHGFFGFSAAVDRTRDAIKEATAGLISSFSK